MAEVGPPFDLYEPSEDEIHSAAADIERHAGDVENLNSATSGAQNRAVVSVAGLLEQPMMATLDNAKAAASSVMQGCVVAGAACRRWAMTVAYYNRRIEELNAEWEAAVADDFGAERPDVGPDAGALEHQGADRAFLDQKNWLRAVKINELTARWRQYQADLETGATEVTGALEPGTASEATLRSLYEGGSLSAAMAPAFPQADYVTGTNPMARWMNLVAGGVIPRELWHMSADEITAYLVNLEEGPWWERAFPDVTGERQAQELAAAFGLLLGLDRLGEQERVFLEALGAYDARAVANFVTEPTPGSESLDRLGQSTARLREINERLAAGGRLTSADKRYLHAWYDGVGADNLAALPGHVEQAISADMNELLVGVSQADEDEYIQRLHASYLSPVADGLMNLSNPDVGGVDRFGAMPQAFQDLATTEVGTTVDDLRHYDLVDGDIAIRNLDRFVGFANLMGASTVQGGHDVTVRLAAEALRVKQELNQIAAFGDLYIYQTAWNQDPDLADELGPESNPNMLALRDEPTLAERQLSDLLSDGDSGVSELLSVVARNNNASSAVLLDDDNGYLPLMLGTHWFDDTGAATVIMAGTDRDPTGGGGTEHQAEAAMGLFLEVASDHDTYLERMSDGVQDAVVDVGINWIDTFARTPEAHDASGVDLRGWVEEELPLAGYSDRVRGISLTRDAQRLFLEFVAGTGTSNPEDGASRFGAAVELNSIKWIADALRTGDEDNINHAVRASATLDGSLTRADYEHSMDEVHDEQLAAQEAALRKQQRIALVSNLAAGGSTSVIWSALLGSPFSQSTKNVGSLAISLALSGGYRVADRVAGVGELGPLVSEIDAESGRLFEENTHAAPGGRNYTLVLAAQAAGADPTEGISDPLVRDEIESLYQPEGDGSQLLRDETGMPLLRPYDELRHEEGRAGTNSDNLRTALDRVGMYPGNVDLVYDDVWETYNSTTYYNSRDPEASQWSDDDTARRLFFGEAGGPEGWPRNSDTSQLTLFGERIE